MGQIIRYGDYLYRAAMYLASGDAFHATHISAAPVSHSVTVVKSANGHLLFLDHRIESEGGTRILQMEDFERECGRRGIYMARPSAVVDGRALWQFARHAALQRPYRFGVGSDRVFCSGMCGIAVAIATGLPIQNKRLGPVDTTPEDFFDEQASGKYFVITPLVHGEAIRRD